MATKNKINISFHNLIETFFTSKDAYATAITLIALPLILGMSAWTIDGARVVNLHTDLQHAADAMAIAGARELDGRDDAIDRANMAIAELIENQAVFANGGNGSSLGTIETISFNPGAPETSSVQIEFLSTIPNDDQTPLGPIPSENATTDPNQAAYVRVVASPRNINSIFPIPNLGFSNVAVAAEATATYVASACNVTPIFICNPFETAFPGQSVNNLFEQGRFYAREFRLVNNGASSPGPGNFGFLRVQDSSGGGASVLRRALAIGRSGVCFRREAIITEPGASTGPVVQGINTRFGIYAGPTGSNTDDAAYRPDINTRIGQSISGGSGGGGNGNAGGAPSCSRYEPVGDLSAIPFPSGSLDTENNPGGGDFFLPDWDLDLYWEIAHGGLESPPAELDDGETGLFVIDEDGEFVPDGDPTIPYTPPPAPTVDRLHQPPSILTSEIPPTPSRYDTYLQEIRDGLIENTSPNGETGASQRICHDSNQGAPNRREIFVAIVNCNAANEDGLNGRTTIEAEAFARMFLTRPAESNGNDRFLSLEMIDVSGDGGFGTVEEVLREEAELVR